MQNIETSYSSYQELLLDLDIFGRLMGLQNLDDKEAFKELLFQEYVKAHPLPTSEGMDCELSEPVSSDYHVSYIQELELSQREEVMNFDEDDDEDEEEEQIEEEQEVDSNLNERYKTSVNEVEDFTGNVEEAENNFCTIETEEPTEEPEDTDEDAEEEFEYDEDGEEINNGYSEEEDADEDNVDYSDDGYDDSEEEISYEDDGEEYSDEQEPEEDTFEYDEDEEEQDGYSSESADNIEDFIKEPAGFIDSVYDNPAPVKVQPRDVEVTPLPVGIPNNRGTPKEEEVDRASLPSDVLQYLRQHPRCEISEVLKYYPRKELEKYIRTGRVIKKGSKVYI